MNEKYTRADAWSDADKIVGVLKYRNPDSMDATERWALRLAQYVKSTIKKIAKDTK